MPHKRKRTRAPGQERPEEEMDLPPNMTVNQTNLSKRRRKKQKANTTLGISKEEMADYPRAYRMLLKQEAAIKQKKEREQQEKQQQAAKKPKPKNDTEKTTKTTKQPLKMQPGESFEEYSERLKVETQKRINEMNRENLAKSERKKRWREKLKEKEKAKKLKKLEEQGLDFNDLRDDVKFGEVVQQPPTLTAIPKARGKAAQQLAAKVKQTGDEKTTAETTSVRPKSAGEVAVEDVRQQNRRRLKAMSAATRRILEEERERVVEAYRAIKEAKLKARQQKEQQV